MTRRLTKVGYKDGRVAIEYEKRRADGKGWDEYVLRSWDEPKPDLPDALLNLVPEVLTICELPTDYGERIDVRSVSFSYGGDDEVMGATITALKRLDTANAPLVLNTPHLPSEPYSMTEGAPLPPLLPESTVEALLELEAAAFAYVDGKRLQRDLFAGAATG